jgi:hypothetical protein
MNNVVLFGGLADVNPYNTWTWDGVDWTLESPATQPANRYDSAAAYEPHLRSVVIFGGGAGGTDIDDTWKWTGVNWSAAAGVFAVGTRVLRARLDPAIDRVVMFGDSAAHAAQPTPGSSVPA